MTNWNRALNAALRKVYASIDARTAEAHRSTAHLGEHHRRALGQRFRTNKPKGLK